MSNDNTPSRAARAASHAGKRERGRLTAQDALGAADRLSAAVLTSRMIEAVISASASAEAARAASIVAGVEASEARAATRRLSRIILPIVGACCTLGGLVLGLFLSHLP
jgi:hypothetical protein